MIFRFSLPLIAAMFLVACAPHTAPSELETASKIKAGSYRFALQIDGFEVPFNAQIILNEVQPKLIIENAGENITVQRVRISEDSLIADMPVFQSSLLCRIESPELLSGAFVDHSQKNITPIPFMAEHGKEFRFTSSKSNQTIPDRYKVVFNPGLEDSFPAILLVKNRDGQLDATFLTETGDFRFLEGNIMNNKIYLSTFDGSHAFYFEAAIDGDSLRNGIFRSGANYQSSWEATADSSYMLTPPEHLTYMVDGYDHVELPFPNQDGDTLSWNEMGLENKVVVVDIFGSWCPNCMDASVALKEITNDFSSNDITIVPVAFERTEDLAVARKRVFKMQEDLGLPQSFLFGGKASKQNAAAKFPMLNNISSFPTIIIIDKNRKVRSIYTGFYGPGTGSYYDTFVQETKARLTDLVADN